MILDTYIKLLYYWHMNSWITFRTKISTSITQEAVKRNLSEFLSTKNI